MCTRAHSRDNVDSAHIVLQIQAFAGGNKLGYGQMEYAATGRVRAWVAIQAAKIKGKITVLVEMERLMAGPDVLALSPGLKHLVRTGYP